MIPGLGKSPGEGLSTPVFLGFPGGSDDKKLPAVWETWVQSLDWEDPLEEGMATHSSILVWKIQRSLEGYGPQACKELVTTE